METQPSYTDDPAETPQMLASRLLKEGKSRSEVETSLVELGLTPKQAAAIVVTSQMLRSSVPPSRKASPQQPAQTNYEYAAEMMKMSNAQIVTALLRRGVTQDEAQRVVRQLRSVRTEMVRKIAVKHMLIGGVICAIGL